MNMVKNLTEGRPLNLLFFFALPMVAGNLFQQLYNMVDTAVVGKFVGEDAVAAVGSSFPIVFLSVAVASGLSMGCTVVVSQLFGAGRIHEMKTTISTAIISLGVLGLLIMGLGTLLAGPLLQLLGTDPDIMADSRTYLQIYFGGAVFLFLYNTLNGIYNAQGDSKTPLIFLMISSLTNIVLDLLFIGVFHTGVGGAAVATILSQFVSAGLCLLQLTCTRQSWRIQLRRIRFYRPVLGQILRFGLPAGLQNSIISFANVVVQSNINAFGEMAMAGCGAYSKIEGFGFLPITSFAMALTTFVGQNLGAGEYERVKKGARFGVLSAVVLAELIGAVVFLFAPALIAAFDSTPEVVRFGVEKSRTAGLFFFLLAYSHSMAAILRGAGNAVIPMVVMLVFWCIVRVTFLTITVPLTQSIQMVYWVYPLTWLLSSVTFFLYSRKADWLHSLE